VFKCDRKANTNFEEEGSKETINAKGELEEAVYEYKVNTIFSLSGLAFWSY